MASSSKLSWTKKINSLQTSENFRPKFILALEIVVGEKKCFICFWAFWKERSVCSFKWVASHVNSFSWWIWNTLGRRIFPLVGIACLITKMSEPLHLSISSESVCNHYCLTCLPCVCVGNFALASVTLALLSDINCDWIGQETWPQWISGIWKTFSVNNRLNFVILFTKNILNSSFSGPNLCRAIPK